MVTRVAWAKSLLNYAALPVTKHNLWALVAWQSAEGCLARWNPLATTRRADGATDWNGVGVKEYRTELDGLDATLATLTEPGHGYEPILAALARDAWAVTTLRAVARSDWGTGALALSILRDVKRHWRLYADVAVGQ